MDDEDDEDRHYVKRGRQAGVSFTERDMDQSGAMTSRPDTEPGQKPSLLSFPSLEHLDRLKDGSPWRSTTRRRRKFRGGIGGLHRRGGEATDRTGDDVEDEVELDRVADIEAVPDTSRRPARSASSISRTASAAARQREKQLVANRGAQPSSEPENRIYRPVKKAQPQPLPPPPLAPRPPAPVNRDALRVAGAPNSSADGEAIESEASRPRRQRRRRQRAEGETVPQISAEPQTALAGGGASEPRVHQPPNGSGNVSRDTSAEVSVKPQPEVSRGERRRSSRRPADSRGAGRTQTRTATVV